MSGYDWADDSWERQARDDRIDRQDTLEHMEERERDDRVTRDVGESGGRVRVRHRVRLEPDGEKAA